MDRIRNWIGAGLSLRIGLELNQIPEGYAKIFRFVVEVYINSCLFLTIKMHVMHLLYQTSLFAAEAFLLQAIIAGTFRFILD